MRIPHPFRAARRAAVRTAEEVDERSGLVRVTRFFLFRNVPRSSGWAHTFGSILLMLFVLQVTTGVLLAFYYQPSGTAAYASIQHITNGVTWGWLLRGLHKWGASFIVVMLFVHMARTFLMGAYKYPRELTWITGVLLFFAFMAMAFTGILLVWDQRSFWATVIGVDISGMTPVIGPFIADTLRGGPHFSDQILPRFYALHMLVVPPIIVGLIGLHVYLVTRLGVTGETWKQDEAAESDAWS